MRKALCCITKNYAAIDIPRFVLLHFLGEMATEFRYQNHDIDRVHIRTYILLNESNAKYCAKFCEVLNLISFCIFIIL